MTGYEQLRGALEEAVALAMADGSTAILFSGGLDSGLLAALAKRHGQPRLYTVGIEGAHDLRMSEEAASLLDLPWTPIVLTPDQVIAACREMLSIVPIESPVVLSFELPLQIIAAAAQETTLISGQGADEMFGGYNRYLEMSPEEREASMAKDLEGVLTSGVRLDQIIASHYRKSIRHPFLDREVRRIASLIPPEEKVRDGVRKAPLRDVLTSLDHDLLSQRGKKAAQYGSGFMNVIKSRAKREKLDLKAFMETLRPEQCR